MLSSFMKKKNYRAIILITYHDFRTGTSYDFKFTSAIFFIQFSAASLIQIIDFIDWTNFIISHENSRISLRISKKSNRSSHSIA